MPLYQVVILAVVQSLTEFLPISSTAHLTLAPWLFGWKDPGLTFDIALHLGTLAAVLLYFFRDWVQIIAQGFGLRYKHDPELELNPRLLWYLALGTIPVAVAGVAFGHQAEGSWRQPLVIGTMLVLIGIVLGIADRRGKEGKDIGKVSFLDTIIIGCAQALAIVPGTSRSGITMTAGLFRKLDRHTAARFSFLLSTPALGGAAFKALYDMHKAGGLEPGMQTAFIIGTLVSAVTGCVIIAFFMRWLREHTFRFFVYYRIVFGIIVIALAFYR